MKKIVTAILCIGMIAPVFAQKALVEQAKKLSGKPEKLEEARSLIKQAIENPETKDQVETYFIAGKIEFDAYDNAYKTKMINPDDPAAQVDVMAQELLNGYNYFLQGLPLDSLPNEKGQIKPKRSKEMHNIIKGHASDFFGVGADYYNAKEYYPQAYEAFMIYGDLPETLQNNDPTVFNPQQIATSYFNAGLAASQGNAPQEGALAFKKARLAGYEKPEAIIYEIASYQTIVQQNEDASPEIQNNIKEAAQAGIDKFGISEPIFINNLINSMVNDGEIDQSLTKLNGLIQENPDAANLYALRAYVYERAENDDLSEADYRKAANMPNADFETLKSASSKLYRDGTQKLNALEGNSPELNAERQNIKTNYFLEAQKYATQADQMNPNDPYVESILENIDYALKTFFNN
ncbi:MAG: hypothetical protein J1F12_07120 [Muribaculaceae bacterium]|nr:hypothetical protein [Muribaculaceae bacterium]